MTRRITRAVRTAAARRGLAALAVAVALPIGCASATVATADPASGTAESVDGEETTTPPQPFSLGLGDFHVRDWRPTRNETPNLRFAVTIEFDADTPPMTRARLPHWINRLRDQTIIAVRLAETKDFAEPNLAQVQRLIRVRVSRILPQLGVHRVLITDFALGDD